MKRPLTAMALAMALATPPAAMAGQSVEVLHWWTAGGEAAALNLLKSGLEKQGVRWNDMPVAGGGGEAAMTAVRARVTSGNPPTAVQMLGFDILDWGGQGVVADLDALAAREGWDKSVPQEVQKFSRYQGRWIAAPVNIHSTNWLWANRQVLAQAGVTAEPASFDEFIAAARKVRQAGYIAIAHGGQPWQEAIVFDSVALSTGGADYYRKAFIERDPATIRSATTRKVFQRMAQIRSLVDKDFSGRDWNVASGMVIAGKAGFQIMGDWAKGEFANAKQQPGTDYLCFPMPGTQGSVSFLSNQFAMFRVDSARAPAQAAMVSASLDPSVQAAFNKLKGSVPARSDVPDTGFDACGQRAMKELAAASRGNTLVGSLAHGHASPTAVKNAFYDVITRHFNGQLDDRKALAAMVAAARN
jgi:glucose/mannose transport system substrate-binding protein